MIVVSTDLIKGDTARGKEPAAAKWLGRTVTGDGMEVITVGEHDSITVGDGQIVGDERKVLDSHGQGGRRCRGGQQRRQDAEEAKGRFHKLAE